MESVNAPARPDPPRPVGLESGEPLHRLVGRRPDAAGRGGGEAGGRAARRAGASISTSAFTSLQTRAIKTLHIVLEAMGRLWLPEEKHWRLNERHYGGLTGLDKAEMAAKHRRGAGEDLAPLVRHPAAGARAGRRRSTSPTTAAMPAFAIPTHESLKDTIARVLPYWEERIAPALKKGQRRARSPPTAIRCAPWSSICRTSPTTEIVGLEIPTGQPIVYELDDALASGRPLLSEGPLT